MTSEQVNQIVFIFLLMIPSLITLGGVMYLTVKITPVALRTVQKLSDNNEELTKISKQNSEQIGSLKGGLSDLKNGIGGMTSELVKQTAGIEGLTKQNRTQGIDFRAYQTLVSDGMRNTEEKVEANTAAIKQLYNLLEQMPQQIILGISDKLSCTTVLAEFQVLRGEITRAMFQQSSRKTGSFSTVPSSAAPASTPALPPETKETNTP